MAPGSLQEKAALDQKIMSVRIIKDSELFVNEETKDIQA